jgi:nucleotide-binding universal stress UspA family protein
MKTIVAPTNFTEVSLNAVRYAADMAMDLGLTLSLVHVCSIPVTYGELPLSVVGIDELIADASERLITLKTELAERSHATIQINTYVEMGDILGRIKDLCSRNNPFAVVLASESADAVERFLVGGKTFSAIHKLSCPVLMVPPGRMYTAIQKIGLACDYKHVLETVPFHEIAALLTALKAELHVLFVDPDVNRRPTGEIQAEADCVEEMFKEFHPVYHYINNDNVAQGLSELVQDNRLDLLLAIPQKRNLIKNLLHHSVSRNMAKHSELPVMTIHE